MKNLRDQFDTPKLAEKHYFPLAPMDDDDNSSFTPEMATADQVKCLFQQLSRDSQRY